jgi:hypothetical protein
MLSEEQRHTYSACHRVLDRSNAFRLVLGSEKGRKSVHLYTAVQASSAPSSIHDIVFSESSLTSKTSMHIKNRSFRMRR